VHNIAVSRDPEKTPENTAMGR